jgi:hypothetical protein
VIAAEIFLVGIIAGSWQVVQKNGIQSKPTGCPSFLVALGSFGAASREANYTGRDGGGPNSKT